MTLNINRLNQIKRPEQPELETQEDLIFSKRNSAFILCEQRYRLNYADLKILIVIGV